MNCFRHRTEICIETVHGNKKLWSVVHSNPILKCLCCSCVWNTPHQCKSLAESSFSSYMLCWWRTGGMWDPGHWGHETWDRSWALGASGKSKPGAHGVLGQRAALCRNVFVGLHPAGTQWLLMEETGTWAGERLGSLLGMSELQATWN